MENFIEINSKYIDIMEQIAKVSGLSTEDDPDYTIDDFVPFIKTMREKMKVQNQELIKLKIKNGKYKRQIEAIEEKNKNIDGIATLYENKINETKTTEHLA